MKALRYRRGDSERQVTPYQNERTKTALEERARVQRLSGLLAQIQNILPEKYQGTVPFGAEARQDWPRHQHLPPPSTHFVLGPQEIKTRRDGFSFHFQSQKKELERSTGP